MIRLPVYKFQGMYKATPRISDFIKVAGYKISTQKSTVFLYTVNEYVDTEIRMTFTITQKNRCKSNKACHKTCVLETTQC